MLAFGIMARRLGCKVGYNRPTHFDSTFDGIDTIGEIQSANGKGLEPLVLFPAELAWTDQNELRASAFRRKAANT